MNEQRAMDGRSPRRRSLRVRRGARAGLCLLVLAFLGVARVGATPVGDLEEADRALAAGEVHRALELFRRVAAGPSSGAAAEALARLCVLSPDADEAVQAATTLLEQYRDHPLTWQAAELLGHFRAARGEYRSAARLFATASARTGDRGDEHDRLELLRGRALLGAGETADARDVFDAILRTRDGSRTHAGDALAAEALLGLGDAALLRGDQAEARRTYGAYLERHPRADGVPIALSQLAHAFDVAEQPDSALVVLERLVSEFPESIEAATARDRLRQQARQSTAAVDPGQSTTAAAPRGHYSLQAGAFGREENAQELARRLQDLELPEVRIEREARDDGNVFYRVRLGSYRDPEEAEAAGKRLRAEHGVVCTVVQR